MGKTIISKVGARHEAEKKRQEKSNEKKPSDGKNLNEKELDKETEMEEKKK